MGLNNEVLGNAGKKSLNSYHKSLIINGLWIQDFCRAAGSMGGVEHRHFSQVQNYISP